MREETLWVEKYRPRKIDDVILPPHILDTFKTMASREDLPNLLLCGRSGTGKTTIARALLDEIGCDYLFLQASIEGNIDTLRTKVTQFASSVSFAGKRKFVILDEADYLTHAVQPALRNVTEQYSKNAGFILTCNFRNKIIEPIQSRLSTIDFNFNKDETNKLTAKFYKRTLEILEKEGIKFDKAIIATYIQTFAKRGNVDFRKILNELQLYTQNSNNEINTGLLAKSRTGFNELLTFMKAKDFTKVRQWIAVESNNDTQSLLRDFYDFGSEYLTPASVAELALILQKYSYESSFCIDQEIVMAACLVEIMINADWK